MISPEPAVSAEEVAETLGVTRAAVYYWAQGRTTPGESYRKRLERVYGIPAADWPEKGAK